MSSPTPSRPRRRFASLGLGLLTGLLLAFLSSFLSSSARELTILHTNDIHGAFAPREADWRDDRRPIGGMEALADRVRDARHAGGGVLLLDAGDIMTGNPICDIEVDGVRGGGLIDLMNTVGYDALALGNHELDISQENALGLARLAEFPVLACNLVRDEGSLFTGHAATVLERDGVRVGVIGVITPHLAGVVQRESLEGLEVLDPVPAVQALADSLDPATDLLVVLSHMGIEEDRRLARQVSGIDLIVGGHSHTRLAEPERVGEVHIAHAGSRLTQAGELRIRVEDDRIAQLTGRLVDLWIDEMEPQPDLGTKVEHYQEAVDEAFGEEIGRLRVDWRRDYHGESNLGNWITDVLRDVTGADFAVLNSGGIRKDLAAGPIRRLDLNEIFPFDNSVCTFRCTGSEILEMARRNATAQVRESYGILQISGMAYTFRRQSDGAELVDIEVAGEPVDPERTYRGASVDFVVISQFDKYLGFQPRDVEELGYRLSEL
ncbi:MAG: hypothetical protein GF355_06290, partial [Candidatus Eisenbacteria bacterium]|nr:hypothetical protein [Candidatus Eisenbacteria bacterium]